MGIWVGRYAMVEGQVQEHGPWLVDQRRERDEGSVRLLVLAEPVDARSAEFCGEVAEAVAALFGREALSVTGGLLRALRQAHANLAEWNERSLREHQVAVGLTCVAIRDGEVTIAQLGAGSVYLIAGDAARRIGTEGLPATAPLGGTEPIEPRFTTAYLDSDHLLLLSSAAEQHVTSEGVLESLAAGPERALAELFTRTRAIRDMTAVLIADLDIEEDTPPSGQPEQLGDPVPVRSLDSGKPEPTPVTPAGAARPDRPRTPALPAVRRAPARVGQAARGPFAAGPTTSRRWGLIGGAAAAVLVLVVLGWLLLPGLLATDGANRLERALTATEVQLDQAERAEAPDARRAALVAALEELERARAADESDPRVLALEAEILAGLATLDAVVEVETLTPVLNFAGSVTTPLEPASIAFGGGFLWLIDSAQGRVLRVDPEGSFDPIEVYAADSLYGAQIAATPIVATWDQASTRLLVLDQDRQLWSIVTDSTVAPALLPLRGADELRSVVAIATYVGNLYVLDPEAGEVWRYLPAGVGYDSERAGLLGAIDLAAATDIAVDGDIYVQDGSTVRRFRQGTEQGSLMIGIDQPPVAPAALVEDVIRGLIFVADRGNGRVVVSSREGPFVRQYRHGAFADLRGLALSADGETLYVLTANGIEAFNVLLTNS